MWGGPKSYLKLKLNRPPCIMNGDVYLSAPPTPPIMKTCVVFIYSSVIMKTILAKRAKGYTIQSSH